MQNLKEKIQQIEWFERHLFLAAAATACLILGCIIHGEQFLLMPQISFLMGFLIVALALPLTTWLPEPIKAAAANVCRLIGIRTLFLLTAITIMLLTGTEEPTDRFVLQVFNLLYTMKLVIIFLGSLQVMILAAATGVYSLSTMLKTILTYVTFSFALVWSVGRYGDTVKQWIVGGSPDQLAGIIAMALIFFTYLCAELFGRSQLSYKSEVPTLGYAKYNRDSRNTLNVKGSPRT